MLVYGDSIETMKREACLSQRAGIRDFSVSFSVPSVTLWWFEPRILDAAWEVLSGRIPAGRVMKKLVVLAVVVLLGPSAWAVEPEVILEQTINLRPEVLELALEAYEQAEEGGHVRRQVLTIIDYELPSYQPRLWVIDMRAGRVVYQEWVAHGMGKPRGSGGTMEEALSFSNDPGTLKSSLGLFITAETYYGRHGYSLKLDGLEEGVNDNARERLIVLHGAQYVTEDRADDRLIGRSWGCPAVRPGISKILIDAIKDGSVLWIYYPHDEWLEESEFLDEE